jgi:hypothetical protein
VKQDDSADIMRRHHAHIDITRQGLAKNFGAEVVMLLSEEHYVNKE